MGVFQVERKDGRVEERFLVGKRGFDGVGGRYMRIGSFDVGDGGL